MNGYSSRERGPVFELPNERHSIFARLTPFAWLILTAAGIGVGAAIVTLFIKAPVSWPALQHSAAKDAIATSPPPAPIVSAPLESQTGAVTATPKARRSATATAVKTAAATHTPEPTVTSEPPPTPAPKAAPERTPATWKSDMVLTEGGAWMASASVVSDTQRVVQNYFDALHAHKTPAEARRDLLEQRDEFLARFFSDNALVKLKRDLSALNTVAQYQSGWVDVAVLRYAEDGLSADVMVRQRAWTVRNWQLAGLKRWTPQRIPDQDAVWQVRYTPEAGWKVASIVSIKAAASASAVRKPVLRKRIVRARPKAVPTVAAPATLAAPSP